MVIEIKYSPRKKLCNRQCWVFHHWSFVFGDWPLEKGFRLFGIQLTWYPGKLQYEHNTQFSIVPLR